MTVALSLRMVHYLSNANNMLEKIVDWVVVSSADPKKVSLTLRGALVSTIPFLVSGINAACGLGLHCVGVSSMQLNEIFDLLIKITEVTLTTIGLIMFATGLVRKLMNTIRGWRP